MVLNTIYQRVSNKGNELCHTDGQGEFTFVFARCQHRVTRSNARTCARHDSSFYHGRLTFAGISRLTTHASACAYRPYKFEFSSAQFVTLFDTRKMATSIRSFPNQWIFLIAYTIFSKSIRESIATKSRKWTSLTSLESFAPLRPSHEFNLECERSSTVLRSAVSFHNL